jgi:hypothetical protein
MNITRQTTTTDAHPAGAVIQLLVTGEKSGVPATPDPELVIEAIWSRATWLGPLMEGILHEPQCQTHLGSLD